jgi:hypothetical protein
MDLISVSDEAMKLPERERAELATRLLQSLQPNVYTSEEEIWASMEARSRKLDEGAAQLISAQSALDSLRKRLDQK